MFSHWPGILLHRIPVEFNTGFAPTSHAMSLSNHNCITALSLCYIQHCIGINLKSCVWLCVWGGGEGKGRGRGREVDGMVAAGIVRAGIWEPL